MKDLFAPPSKEELQASNDDLFAPPSEMELLGEERPKGYVSAVRKGLQGATAGFSDEAAGVVEAVGRVFGFEGAGGPMKDISRAEGMTLDSEILKKAYEKARDKERMSLEQDQKINPKISTAAEIGGAVVSPVNKIAKGASLAKQGAAVGAIMGAGKSDSDSLGGVLLDTGLGAAGGAVIGKVADFATPIAQKATNYVGNKSKNAAEWLSARAQGAERGTIKKLGAQRVKEIGRHGLDNKIISPLASTDDLIARNAAAEARGGKMMGEVFDEVDNAGVSNFNPKAVAEKVDETLAPSYRTKINRSETRQLDNTLDSIMARVSSDTESISIKEAQALKQELGTAANWRNKINVTPKEQMARDAYGIVNKAIDEAAESGSKAIGKKGLQDTLAAGKKLVSNSKGAAELLQNKQAREQGNKIFGLTDTITGGSALGYGGMTGDWETAGLIFAGKKGLEKYGAQNAAIVLNKVAKTLLKNPQMANLAKSNPAGFQETVLKMAKPQLEKLPRVADDKPEASLPKKGPAAWVSNGAEKLKSHGMKDMRLLEKLKSSAYGRELLIRANDLQPGSKGMQGLFNQIKKLNGGPKDG